MTLTEPYRRCEVCNRLLRKTGVVGERLVVSHCADRLVCRVAAATPALWGPGRRDYFDG